MFTASTTLLRQSGNPVIAKHLTMSLTRTATFASFSAATPDKETLFNEMIAAANGISDYNFKSYFVRRAIEDKAQIESFSVEDIQERLEQMKRIRTVQNLYLSPDQRSLMETKRPVQH